MPKKAKRRINQTASKVRLAPSKKTIAPPGIATAAGSIFRSAPAFQALVFLTAFAILISRRPDAVFNAQFYAEDGMTWYPQAYQLGLQSLLIPVLGYLHALIRTVALFSLLFPFSLAPLVMNLCAMLVQILPVNVFLSSRFSTVPLRIRLLAGAAYLALPNCWEIHANITNVQWHLVLLACIVLLASPAIGKWWRIFDAIVLVFASLSSPISVLLIPVAAVLWWKRRRPWSLASFLMIIPGAMTQTMVALFSNTRSAYPLGPSLDRFINILGRQVFFSSLLGWKAQSWLAPGDTSFIVAAVATVVGLTAVGYAVSHSTLELRVFVVFCLAVFALSLSRPMAGPPEHAQWLYLCIPGRGSRYYFFPMLGFLSSLFWIASEASSRVVRYGATTLLLLLPIGILMDWSHPPFDDYHFQEYAQQFERMPSGTKFSLPIPPGMTMEITKK